MLGALALERHRLHFEPVEGISHGFLGRRGEAKRTYLD